MSMDAAFSQLALLTLRDPKAAAGVVLGWQLSREAILTAVALVSVLATILSTLSNLVIPLPEPLQSIGGNPFIYLLIALGGFIVTVHAIYWAGRMLGGEGALLDLMALLLWLQGLRVAAQAVILLVLLTVPALGSLLALFVAVATFWIFVNFISIGLQLNSLARAFFVLMASVLAIMLGLSLLLSLIGVSTEGVF